MGNSAKTIRLSGKLADELGVNMPTIIKFLAEKGHGEIRPNEKISEEICQDLLKQFQSDSDVRDKARSAGTEKTEKETITLKETKASVKGGRGVEDDVLIKDVQNITAEDEPKKKKGIDVKIVGKLDAETLSGKSEKKKQQSQTPVTIPPEEEIIRAKAEKIAGPKVVGEIKLPEPVASSSDNVKFKRRKRKRIRWEKQGFEKSGYEKTGKKGVKK